MKRAWKLSEAEKHAMAKERRAGASLHSLAKKFNITAAGVCCICSCRGVRKEKKHEKPKKMPYISKERGELALRRLDAFLEEMRYYQRRA